MPFWHLGISTTAVIQVLIPKAVRQSFAENLVLLTDHQIEEVAQQVTLLDRRCQNSVGGNVLPHPPPLSSKDRSSMSSSRPRISLASRFGRRRAAGLEDVLLVDRLSPPLRGQTTDQQISDHPALGQFQRPSRDVRSISHSRRPAPDPNRQRRAGASTSVKSVEPDGDGNATFGLHLGGWLRVSAFQLNLSHREDQAWRRSQ